MSIHSTGLSSAEVERKQAQFGLNTLPEKPPPKSLFIFLEQLKNPLIYVLLFAGVVTAIIGELPDTVIIFCAVSVNTLLGFFQEQKAAYALHALKHFVTQSITVIRDNNRQVIDASQLVPEDIVILKQGDKIPADGELISANRLYIDEAIITGESVAVEKRTGGMVFMGTTITSGQAVMRIAQIGAATQIGKIALEIQAKEEESPFQLQLRVFSKQLVVVVIILLTVVFSFGLLHSFSAFEIFTTSVALAVSSIPEGLIVSLTVVLTIGMQRILRRRGLVRKLAAAETLGGVTVICVDKTGTLTEGKMKVDAFIGDKQALAQQVVVANDLDDPMVVVAYEWGQAMGQEVPPLKRIDSIPFSSEERFFISLHQYSAEKNRVFVNGAPDVLLPWTTLAAQEKTQILHKIDDLTKEGKRIIGFARKDVGVQHQHLTHKDAKSDLTWVGLLVFSDPIRSGVKDVLEKTAKAGIRTVLITGDYAPTAVFVLKELGIHVHEREVMTGDQIAYLSSQDFIEKIENITLFARTTPDQKLLIVEALKKKGEVVAMMGDGVNDAPALHRADIGVAVADATDVAKESADLILLDSNFSVIAAAVEEGRVLFENIRKIILYLLSDAFAEIVVVLGSIFFNLPLPITAVQILWINLISDGFPQLALTIDPQRSDIMNEKPRSPSEKLINKWMIALIGIVSITAGLLAFAVFVFMFYLTQDVLLARSMTFITLGMNSLAYVFSVRSLMVPFWKNHLFENKWLIGAVSAGFGIQVIPFISPQTRTFFGLSELQLWHWILAIVLSILLFFLVEVFKFVYFIRHHKNIRKISD